MRVPVIAIIGRPNVGKSTLFNRVIGKREALVEDEEGVTRDRNYEYVDRYAIPFHLVDTGGFEDKPQDELRAQVVEQTLLAVEEADVLLVLFDGSVGVQPGDEEVVDLIRRYRKPCVFGVNKCDGAEQSLRVVDFYQLGVDELHPLSALHGIGASDILDIALQQLPDYQELVAEYRAAHVDEEQSIVEARFELEQNFDELDKLAEQAIEQWDQEDEEVDPYAEQSEPKFAPVFVPGETFETEIEYLRQHKLRPAPHSSGNLALKEQEEIDALVEEEQPKLKIIKVAILGRPNVGKSTLLNALAGEKRSITSNQAGTTRDTVDFELDYNGNAFKIMDTAGLRKKSKVSARLERYSTLRALSSLGEADVAVCVIDAVEGPTEQDAKIVGLAHSQGRGIVIAVNKWDLVEKDHTAVKKFTDDVRDAFRFAAYAPIVFMSAISGRRCIKVLEHAQVVAVQRQRRVHTGKLNRILQRAVKQKTPPNYRGMPIRLYYASQIASCPPRFVLFFSHPKEIHFSYMRYLKNCVRDQFEFSGVDLKLMARKA